MTKEEFDIIIKEQFDSKSLPNSRLIEMMDILSNDFEITKQNLMSLSVHLDNVEELYNKILKEYQTRVK